MSVPSPCIGVCKVSPNQVCQGCGRTLAEIAAWSQLSERAKARVVTDASQRLRGLQDDSWEKESSQ